LLDPQAVLATTIGLIALLDNTVINSTRHQIITIGHPVIHVTILSHQVTVASKIICLTAKVTTKIGPLAIQIDLAKPKVTNQVVTIQMLLVTTRIGPLPVVVTPVTGHLAVQTVRATSKGLIASKIRVTNTEIEAVPLTVTALRQILVTVSLGKTILATANRIGTPIGPKVTVVTVPEATPRIISQEKIAPPTISQMVTSFAQSVWVALTMSIFAKSTTVLAILSALNAIKVFTLKLNVTSLAIGQPLIVVTTEIGRNLRIGVTANKGATANPVQKTKRYL
jgi:hypothetical protein